MLGEPRSVATECLRVPCVYLLYHRICRFPAKYSYNIEKGKFEQHVDVVAQAWGDPNHRVSAEITFDDGHASDFEYAFPILAVRGVRAHFFITVGRIENEPGYMRWQQVRRLCDAGHIIGAHGWSHALLTHCSQTELDHELRASRETLEDKLGIPVSSMSLPGGRYNRRVLAACREAGYARVFTSMPRLETAIQDFLVGRINISAHRSPDWICGLLQPHSRELAKVRRQYRIKRSARAILGDWAYERIWGVVTGRILDTEVETAAAHENSATHQ